MDVLASRQAGPNTIHLEVSIPYDGDLADAATVTATLIGPDGEVITDLPVPHMTPVSYAADLSVPGPGTWLVALTSVQPVAEANRRGRRAGRHLTADLIVRRLPVPIVVRRPRRCHHGGHSGVAPSAPLTHGVTHPLQHLSLPRWERCSVLTTMSSMQV